MAKEIKKTKKLKPLFKKEVELKECFILYNQQTNNIDYIEDISTKEESSYLILFSLVSICLMITSNILFKKYNASSAYSVYSAFAAAIAAIAAIANIIIFITAPTIAVVLAVILAVAAAFFAAFADDENYEAYSIIFYILMAIYIIPLFI